jgi:hypothetical protein
VLAAAGLYGNCHAMRNASWSEVEVDTHGWMVRCMTHCWYDLQVLSAGTTLLHTPSADGTVHAVAMTVTRVGIGWSVTLQPGVALRNLTGQAVHLHFTGANRGHVFEQVAGGCSLKWQFAPHTRPFHHA